MIIGPLARRLSLPLIVLTLALFILAVNAALLALTAELVLPLRDRARARR